MRISLLSQFFLLCILLTFWSTDFTLVSSQCLDDQKALLVELKDNLMFGYSLPRILVQWNQTEDCCTWNGVECDGAGHVVSLELDGVGISGGIDNSSSLFSLRYLEKLNLAFNNFNCSLIPRGIHNLTHLTHLNLSNAGFGGQVPMELSLMKRLVSLDLSSQLSSFVPLKIENPNLKMLLQNLTGLEELYLDSVDISSQGSEWCHAISSSLPELRNLSLRRCNLSGPLDSSLLQLRSLSVLQLDINNLSTTVPGFFANFSSLTTLTLSFCSLQGIFPGEIFQVPTLQNLDLSENGLLSGTIPQFHQIGAFREIVLAYTNFSGPLPDSIGNLSMLSVIDLSNCKFTGSVPSSLFGLPLLQRLFLSNNQFSGLGSEVINLHSSNMDTLDLRGNQIKGPIPESVFKLERLNVLSLSHNLFNGTLQLEKIQRLHNLSRLDLSYNNLTFDASNSGSSLSRFPQLNHLALASCNLHNFPDLINQSTLTILDLSSNNIAGEIPSWIWEIGSGNLSHLNLSSNLLTDLQKPYKIPDYLLVLDLHSNQLRGELPVPPPIAAHVDYSNNKFANPIPLDIVKFTSSLSFFSLANNNLSGVIPTSLCNSSYLRVLDLSANRISGNIPSCLMENIQNLGVLNLGRNNISGDIPDTFSVNCGLNSLALCNNNLQGNIPPSLANCKLLEVMNVGNNNIGGTFPCMLSSSLRVLVLHSNRFRGEVRCSKTWPNLQIVDIASNNFSGYLYPSSFSSWGGMMLHNNTQLRSKSNHLGYTVYSDVYYLDKVSLVVKGQMLEYVKIPTVLTSLDFSCNNFHGEIPDEIGDLSSLCNLNLSHNSLTGRIPRSMGNLTQLGSLDLSKNRLTGEIPQELEGPTFLSFLNLSYNKLVGRIPIGSQFQTFSAACYEGNTELCGYPLAKSCDVPDENGGGVESYQKKEIEWEYVSAALGFVVGIGSTIWLLFGCKSLSEKFSEQVEQILLKIFDRQGRKTRRGGRVARNQVIRRN